jgi:translocation and assembly module TamA
VLILVTSPAHAADPVEIEISGVEGAALKNVRDALTLPYGLVRDDKVDRLWLDRFVGQAPEKVTRAMQPYGFYHAKVTVNVQPNGTDKYLLVVAVVPGPPVVVTGVDVKLAGAGAGEADLRQLVRAFPLVKGNVLLQPQYEHGKSALKARAIGLGYLDADFTRHEIRIAPGETTATIALTMDTGQRYYFDGVIIQGAPEYPEEYLKRFVGFKAGEVFSYAKIGETQLNFSNSERFKSVVINPQKELAREQHVPVLITLTSAPRRSIRPGVGYGTDTGGRFVVHYRDLNLFYKGQDMDVTLYVAQRLQGLAARYTIPVANDLKSSNSFQLNLQQEDVTSYTSQLGALEFDYNRALGLGEVATPYIRLQQENFTVAGQKSSSRLIMPGFRFTKEHFDSLIRPTEGYRYAFDMRGSSVFFGSDTGFAQLIADGNAVLPLPWRLSLHLRSRVGTTFLSDPVRDLPPSVRFFAGGDQSVRGFSYQSLGPRNQFDQVIGGKHVLTGTVELERALYQNWGVSLFHDAGNAFNDFTNVRLYQGAGIGVHYYSPVGAINISLAKRLQTPKQIYYIHLTVGFQL